MTPVLEADIGEWEELEKQLASFGLFGFVQLSPPCQLFLRSTNKASRDAQAGGPPELARTTARLVVALSLGVFLLENVPTMLSPPTNMWRAVEPIYAAAGYTL